MAKRVTPEEETKIVELYNDGMNMTMIAATLGRSAKTVSQRITDARKLGLLHEQPKVENPLKRDREGTPACCKGCKHRRRILGLQKSMTYCSYANDMEAQGQLGVVRGCPVDKCRHYEKGKPERRHPIVAERGGAI